MRTKSAESVATVNVGYTATANAGNKSRLFEVDDPLAPDAAGLHPSPVFESATVWVPVNHSLKFSESTVA